MAAEQALPDCPEAAYAGRRLCAGAWETADPAAHPTILDPRTWAPCSTPTPPPSTVTVSGLTLQRGRDYGLYFQNSRLLLSDSAVISTTKRLWDVPVRQRLFADRTSRIANNYYGAYAYSSEHVTLQATPSPATAATASTSITTTTTRRLPKHDQQQRSYGIYFYNSNNYATLEHNVDHRQQRLMASTSTMAQRDADGQHIANNSSGGLYLSGCSSCRLDNNLLVHNAGVGPRLEQRRGRPAPQHHRRQHRRRRPCARAVRRWC